jgi:hypothetical protein
LSIPSDVLTLISNNIVFILNTHAFINDPFSESFMLPMLLNRTLEINKYKMHTARNREQSVLFIIIISVAFIVNKNVIDKIIDKVHASFTINYAIKINLKKMLHTRKVAILKNSE